MEAIVKLENLDSSESEKASLKIHGAPGLHVKG